MTTEYEGRKNTRPATSIPIQPDKLRAVLRRNFLTNIAASEMLGKSRTYINMILMKRKMNLYMIDQLATELGMHANDLFDELVDEDEWMRF